MRYDLLFYTKWPYIITAVVSCCVVIASIFYLIKKGFTKRIYIFHPDSIWAYSIWSDVYLWAGALLLPIIIVFCLSLYYSVSGVRKIHSIEKDGGYIIEIPEKIFPDNNDLLNRDFCLVSSFCIYSEGLVCFDYTIPASNRGTKYVYNFPAEYPADRIYKGVYTRIYGIREGRFLLYEDLEKFIAQEDRK